MSKVFNEPRHAGEFILSEANSQRSREGVTIGASQNIEAGTVLALLAQAGGVTTSVDAASGNTGDGTLAMASPAVSSKAKNGTYTATATSATVFAIESPSGASLGNATVGAAFNKEIKFTITAGTAAFVAGDSFKIAVGVETPGDYHAVAYDPDGQDGSEKAAAIAIYPAVTGSSETVKIAAIFRDAEVNGQCIAWPEDVTTEQKAAATADLASVGILVR